MDAARKHAEHVTCMRADDEGGGTVLSADGDPEAQSDYGGGAAPTPPGHSEVLANPPLAFASRRVLGGQPAGACGTGKEAALGH